MRRGLHEHVNNGEASKRNGEKQHRGQDSDEVLQLFTISCIPGYLYCICTPVFRLPPARTILTTTTPASGAATRAHDDQKGDEVDGHSFASSAARHTCPLYLHPDTRLNRAPVALLVTGHTTVPLSHVYLPVARDAAWWSAVQLPPLWKSRRRRP
ncbi:hypothetical protein BN1723_007809 [Verticillium longisporum]|uniref:Uncharacterized protein n=1 Tax=Verticillium longisporum TaxID=100787 RepID=A0A0G4NNG6_VERLO|nr:hypothetical protein BN1723_007809 [Verticillium longisporum]